MEEITYLELRDDALVAGNEALMEATMAKISNSLGAYHQRLTRYFNGVYRTFNDFRMADSPEIVANVSAAKRYTKRRYFDLSTRTAFVVSGLDASYLEHTEGVLKLREQALEYWTKTLDDFEFWIGRVNNSTDLLSSLTIEHEVKERLTGEARKDATDYGKLFTNRNPKDRGLVREYFKSNSEIEETYANVSRIRYDRAFPRPGEVVERVKRINETVGSLVKTIETLDDKSRPSKKAMKAIYDVTLNIADIVEFMGLYYAERQKLVVAFEQTLRELR